MCSVIELAMKLNLLMCLRILHVAFNAFKLITAVMGIALSFAIEGPKYNGENNVMFTGKAFINAWAIKTQIYVPTKSYKFSTRIRTFDFLVFNM